MTCFFFSLIHIGSNYSILFETSICQTSIGVPHQDLKLRPSTLGGHSLEELVLHT